ncbi:MAG: Na+/H+ antiporter NhaA [Myxococcota bacterium]|nr:Na+/H+ antiporter NhaA [Myxococcales bacterium]
MSESSRGAFVTFLLEFSIPLLAGVVVALAAANLAHETYEHLLHAPWGPLAVFGHALDLHFVANEIFMVFFFGIAAKEITESVLPGGSLNPPRKAMNPLFSTLGGVLGPIAVFFAGLSACHALDVFGPSPDWPLLSRGWGIPTATDIALAWLCARFVFGRGHPAIDFLLLLAIADDAIGLVIIAVFYGNPAEPTNPAFLGLVLAAMAVAFGLRRAGVRAWLPYVALAGPIAWSGLLLAHLHPALALCFVVPFMPAPRRDTGLFRADDEIARMGEPLATDLRMRRSTLEEFEHAFKLPVDLGLFFFAFANAGVAFADIGPMTWLVLGALVVGKLVGISLFGSIAAWLGFPLPTGMARRDLYMAGFIAALGLTVALFVATAAFRDPVLQGQAKMGALFSGVVGLVAVALGRALGMGGRTPDS